MKGRFYLFVLSLFLTFGLVFGQANQDAGGAAGDQPAPEAPAGQDAAGQEGAEPAQADMAADQSIIQVLQSNPDFSTFADALQRAGLEMTLEQEGPFTILAPTNQAFEQANIDLATLEQQALTSLVRNHIISGMVTADQLSTLAGVVTLLGTEYAVVPPTGQQPVAGAEQPEGEVAGGGAAEPAQPDQAEQPGDVDPAQDAAADVPMGQPGADGAVGLAIGEATVTQAGIQASSGVVYGIDSVLVPEGVQGIEGGGGAQPAEPGMDEPPAPGEEGQPAGEPAPGEEGEPAAPDADGADMGDDAGAGDAGGAEGADDNN